MATSDGPAAPTLCGTITGQHMIVEARDDCNEVTVAVNCCSSFNCCVVSALLLVVLGLVAAGVEHPRAADPLLGLVETPGRLQPVVHRHQVTRHCHCNDLTVWMYLIELEKNLHELKLKTLMLTNLSTNSL